jgi:exopolysaccharide biosynthesis polyprenyl glycosylphosphotransferase
LITGDASLGHVDAQHAEQFTIPSTVSRGRVIPLRLRGWVGLVVAGDTAAVSVAAMTALLARFGPGATAFSGVDYHLLSLALVPAWLITMGLAGTYDSRFIAAGAEQYRRVLNGGAWLLAVMAFISFALRADVSRGFVLVSIPLTTLLTMVMRFGLRKALHRRFASKWSAHRVVAIGSPHDVSDLAVHMHRASYAGFRVVAALTPGESRSPSLPAGVLWAGSDVANVVDWATQHGVDTLAVAGSHVLERGALRKLSWALEGTQMQLFVAPGMTDLAGPRIRSRPVDGLPLLQIEKPQFSGARRLAKASIDEVASILLLLGLSPLITIVALSVRLTSHGPVIFRQTRVGQNGKQFSLLKFRTMYQDAEYARSSLEHLNESNSVLFKIRRDPRLTPVGWFLRRFSLDELPQLGNVARGQMSLVGPRPPLPSEVERYGEDVHRRLLVKPGLTGMWQVNGRADLSWEESVRLDLYYVDHWSVGLDLVLLGKTLMTVIRGRGAY